VHEALSSRKIALAAAMAEMQLLSHQKLSLEGHSALKSLRKALSRRELHKLMSKEKKEN